jgi:hypothetical protein
VKGCGEEEDGKHALAAVETRSYEGEIQVPDLVADPQERRRRYKRDTYKCSCINLYPREQ